MYVDEAYLPSIYLTIMKKKWGKISGYAGE
jgi:hypothetical protein